MDEKRFRFDLLLAGTALVISTIAAGASAYQRYIINQQFSATVWPYLNFSASYDRSNAFIEFSVRNSGLGPAIVRSAIVTLRGNRMPPGPSGNAIESAVAPDLAAARTAEKAAHLQRVIHMTTSSLLRGDVIPAGSSITLLRASGPLLVSRIAADQDKIDIAVCYCSLLGRCWILRRSDDSNEPHDVRSCPLS